MKTTIKKEERVLELINYDVLTNQDHLVNALLRNQVGSYIDYEDIINLRINTEEEAKDHGYDSLEELQESGDDDMKEVYEWWLVTGYLARQIKELGGVVIESEYGTWWGREETGQSLTIDSMLNSVADKLIEVKS